MKRLGFVMLSICLLFSGCFHKENREIEIQLPNTYVTDVTMNVYGNKLNSKYKLYLHCSLPDFIRIETIEPEYLKGKVIIKNGRNWKIEHPLFNQNILAVDAFQEVDLLRMGVFGSWMHRTGKQYEDPENKNQVCIEHVTNQGQKSILHFNTKKMVPVNLEIIGADGKVLIDLEYLRFERKESLQTKLFTIE